MSQVSRFGYYLCCLLEQLDKIFIEIGVVVGIGFLLGARFQMVNPIVLLGTLAIAIFVFFSMSLFISSILVFTRESYLTLNTLFVLIDFLCGTMFPVEFLNKYLRFIANMFPLTHILRIVRGILINGDNVFMYSDSILFVIVESAVFCVGGLLFLRKIESSIVEKVLL